MPQLMDPDSDPDADPDFSIFITDLQDANKKTNFLKKVFLYITFLRSQNSKNQGFSYYVPIFA